MKDLKTFLPDYSLWSRDFKHDEVADLLKLLRKNFEKDLEILRNKLKTEKVSRKPGTGVETWDTSLSAFRKKYILRSSAVDITNLLQYRSGHEAKIEIIALFDCSYSFYIIAVRTEKGRGGEGKGNGSLAIFYHICKELSLTKVCLVT